MVRSITLDDELQKEFDMAVIKRFGYKRGNKKRAAEEAIKLYIKAINDGTLD